jgi:hypothetical protein
MFTAYGRRSPTSVRRWTIWTCTEEDLTRTDVVAQFGLPPNRIDILTGISGVTFERAWANRVEAVLEGVQVPVLGLADLLENKRAAGREKDRADLKGLSGKS